LKEQIMKTVQITPQMATEGYEGDYTCPACQCDMLQTNHKYCFACGVKLEWDLGPKSQLEKFAELAMKF
jgi:hypothetical protein